MLVLARHIVRAFVLADANHSVELTRIALLDALYVRNIEAADYLSGHCINRYHGYLLKVIAYLVLLLILRIAESLCADETAVPIIV